MRTAVLERPARAQRKTRRGDILHTKWTKRERQVEVLEVLEGPYLQEEAAECDCGHWAEVVDALGGENQF